MATPAQTTPALPPLRQPAVWLAAACVLLLGLYAQLYMGFQVIPDTINRLEKSMLDQRLRFRARNAMPAPNIVIVSMDERSLQWFDAHPELKMEGYQMPRDWLAKVIDYLKDHGARSIILDVSLSVPQTPERDKALADAIQRAGNVFVSTYGHGRMIELLDQTQVEELSGPALKEYLDLRRPQLLKECGSFYYAQQGERQPGFLEALEKQHINASVMLKDNTLQDAITYCRMNTVLPRFLNAAHGLGISTIWYDNEGFLRQIPALYFGYKNNPYAYMGVRVAQDLMGNPPLEFMPGKMKLGKKTIPLIDGHSIMINWRNPATLAPYLYQKASLALSAPALKEYQEQELDSLSADKYNAAIGLGSLYRNISVAGIVDLIRQPADAPPSEITATAMSALYDQPKTGPFDFTNTIVIYGDTIKDIHRSPVGNAISGPEIIATVIDNLLNDDTFVHPSPGWMNALIVMILVGMILFAVLRLKRLHVGFLSGSLALMAFWMYNFMLFSTHALWIPLVWPSLVGLLTLTGSTLYRYYVQDREKRELTGVFSKYVSPQIMNRILSNPGRAMQDLQGDKKILTVMFTDIHNFTSQFEQAEPEQIVQNLNDYFNTMTSLVLDYEGTCDKYMGDSLMAFFGAPADLPDHAEKACRAALKMQKALVGLNERLESEGRQPLRHGIGISTGPMFVGNFGSDEIKNFSVVGSVVNLGARLETQTRASNVPIIISEETYRHVQSWAVVDDLGEMTVKGFSHPVRMYALRGDKNEPE